MERGEITLDKDFFTGFTADLRNDKAWQEFNLSFRNKKRELEDTASPTQLGDHVSLKAEAADSKPTGQETGSKVEPLSSKIQDDGPPLSKLAKDTAIGDPVSLGAKEVVEPDQSNKNESNTPNRNSSIPSQPSKSGSLPPLPTIDGESLFWAMMSASRQLDPYIFPALQRLRKQKPRPIIGALSNTVKYPLDHPWSKPGKESTTSAKDAFLSDPNTFFDVYIASADVGMRKPSIEIYELAIQKLVEQDKKKGAGNVIKPEEILFLDDIGENLKAARDVGMKTIRVQLGKTWRAVKELEEALGLDLMDEKTRRSKL